MFVDDHGTAHMLNMLEQPVTVRGTTVSLSQGSTLATTILDEDVPFLDRIDTQAMLDNKETS